MIKQADNTDGYVQALQQLLDTAAELKHLGQQNALRSNDFFYPGCFRHYENNLSTTTILI